MLTGFPLKEYEVTDKTGGTLWVPESQIEKYNPTGHSRMSYAIPKWLEEGMRSNAKYKVLLLDDYSRASPQVLQICMSIIEEKSFVSWNLGPEWTVVLTQNPDNDSNYSVNTLDAAQESRFLSWQVRYDKEIWCKWALKTGIDERCVNFIYRFSDEIFNTQNHEINPRIITKFFNVIRSVKDFASPEGMKYCLFNAQSTVSGDAGVTFAQVFNQFINKGLDKIPTPEDLLSTKDYKIMLGKVKNSIFKNVNGEQQYRDDIAGILMFRLVNYLVELDKGLEKWQLENIATLLLEDDLREDLIFGICDKLVHSKSIRARNIIGKLVQIDKRLITKLKI